MTFYFARVQDDGRLTSPLPQSFATIEDAKAAAPELLARLATRKGSRVVLVQVIEDAMITAMVTYRKWPLLVRQSKKEKEL
jgi:hypothetical protein